MIGPGENTEINCPTCGARLEADLPACPLCGTALPAGQAPAARLPGRPDLRLVEPAPPSYPTYIYPPPAPPPGAPPGMAPVAAPLPVAPEVAPPRARRTGLWLGLGLGLLLGLCVVTALGGGAFLALGGGRLFTPPTPTPLDPTALLDQAAGVQDQMKTAHYLMTGELNAASAQVPSRLALEGDVVRPDSYSMHSDLYGDRIVIGQDVYTRPPGGTTWQKGGPSADQQADPTNNPTALLTFIKYYTPESATLQNDVISGTQRLQVVQFDVDLDRMSAQEGPDSPAAALQGANVQGTVRLDTATHRIDRLTLDISAPGTGTATLTIQLSRYNAPVTISPPPGQDQ